MLRAALSETQHTTYEFWHMQHIEKVLPGGILHAPVAVSALEKSRDAEADRRQLAASACYLRFVVRDCGLHDMQGASIACN